MQRSLWPREHGAYVQLLAPLATALVIRQPTVPAILFAIAACSAFLAHEALMVARGARGIKRRELDGARAAGRVRLCGGIALLCTTIALVLAPRYAIALAPLVAIPVGLTVVLASRHALHTLVGELAAAIALAGATVPVAAAGGLPPDDVLALWMAWSVGFATTVVVVRGVITNHRLAKRLAITTGSPRSTAFALFAIVAWLGMATMIVPLAAVAIPLVIASMVVEIAAPSARSVRTIGIALACASVVAGALAIYIA